jgi:cell wall-associated NlpC family hydrolase
VTFSKLLTIVLLCAVFSGCTPWPELDTAAPVASSDAPRSDREQQVVSLAKDQVGVPYVYGGHTPQGFDCSGLVYYVYGQVGVRMPRTAGAQYNHTRRVAQADLEPGDLVFFLDANHVGIYVGDGWFIHAPETGKPVEGAWLNVGYWHDHYYGAGRP